MDGTARKKERQFGGELQIMLRGKGCCSFQWVIKALFTVVNEIYFQVAVKYLHDMLEHRDIKATVTLVIAQFWWSIVQNDVVKCVNTCDLCQDMKGVSW